MARAGTADSSSTGWVVMDFIGLDAVILRARAGTADSSRFEDVIEGLLESKAETADSSGGSVSFVEAGGKERSESPAVALVPVEGNGLFG